MKNENKMKKKIQNINKITGEFFVDKYSKIKL